MYNCINCTFKEQLHCSPPDFKNSVLQSMLHVDERMIQGIFYCLEQLVHLKQSTRCSLCRQESHAIPQRCKSKGKTSAIFWKILRQRADSRLGGSSKKSINQYYPSSSKGMRNPRIPIQHGTAFGLQSCFCFLAYRHSPSRKDSLWHSSSSPPSKSLLDWTSSMLHLFISFPACISIASLNIFAKLAISHLCFNVYIIIPSKLTITFIP